MSVDFSEQLVTERVATLHTYLDLLSASMVFLPTEVISTASRASLVLLGACIRRLGWEHSGRDWVWEPDPAATIRPTVPVIVLDRRLCPVRRFLFFVQDETFSVGAYWTSQAPLRLSYHQSQRSEIILNVPLSSPEKTPVEIPNADPPHGNRWSA
jgi:hypothetical protein